MRAVCYVRQFCRKVTMSVLSSTLIYLTTLNTFVYAIFFRLNFSNVSYKELQFIVIFIPIYSSRGGEC